MNSQIREQDKTSSGARISCPSPQDFCEAVQTPRLSFEDEELAAGSVQSTALGLPVCMSGNFASVFCMQCVERKFAVRCFLHNIPDLQQRYSAIASFVSSDNLECTVPFQYLERGIKVHGEWYPILKMEWVDGITLSEFVSKYANNSMAVNLLAGYFKELVIDLSKSGIAHGDLQHDNILISEDSLRLVDYDGLFVPALKGCVANELGHANYQHPKRTRDDFAPYLDHFSAWVIYLSLRALSIDPNLLNAVQGGADCILLKQADLKDPDHSAAFRIFARHPDERIRTYGRILRYFLDLSVDSVPSIDKSINEIKKAAACFEVNRFRVPNNSQTSWLVDSAAGCAHSGHENSSLPEWLTHMVTDEPVVNGSNSEGKVPTPSVSHPPPPLQSQAVAKMAAQLSGLIVDPNANHSASVFAKQAAPTKQKTQSPIFNWLSPANANGGAGGAHANVNATAYANVNAATGAGVNAATSAGVNAGARATANPVPSNQANAGTSSTANLLVPGVPSASLNGGHQQTANSNVGSMSTGTSGSITPSLYSQSPLLVPGHAGQQLHSPLLQPLDLDQYYPEFGRIDLPPGAAFMPPADLQTLIEQSLESGESVVWHTHAVPDPRSKPTPWYLWLLWFSLFMLIFKAPIVIPILLLFYTSLLVAGVLNHVEHGTQLLALLTDRRLIHVTKTNCGNRRGHTKLRVRSLPLSGIAGAEFKEPNQLTLSAVHEFRLAYFQYASKYRINVTRAEAEALFQLEPRFAKSSTKPPQIWPRVVSPRSVGLPPLSRATPITGSLPSVNSGSLFPVSTASSAHSGKPPLVPVRVPLKQYAPKPVTGNGAGPEENISVGDLARLLGVQVGTSSAAQPISPRSAIYTMSGGNVTATTTAPAANNSSVNINGLSNSPVPAAGNNSSMSHGLPPVWVRPAPLPSIYVVSGQHLQASRGQILSLKNATEAPECEMISIQQAAQLLGNKSKGTI